MTGFPWRGAIRRPQTWLRFAVFAASALSSCSDRGTTAPTEGALAPGRWAGNGACLSVTDTDCDLVIGCGHGQFSPPAVRGDGSFDVDGTYRIEIGPVSIEPAPPAHFSGAVMGSTLTLRVVPSAPLPAASYSLTLNSRANCAIRCV